jgi:hypothetical protein
LAISSDDPSLLREDAFAGSHGVRIQDASESRRRIRSEEAAGLALLRLLM